MCLDRSGAELADGATAHAVAVFVRQAAGVVAGAGYETLGEAGFVGALAGEEAVRLKWGRGWMSLDGCG
jgi:hypothetical protein